MMPTTERRLVLGIAFAIAQPATRRGGGSTGPRGGMMGGRSPGEARVASVLMLSPAGRAGTNRSGVGCPAALWAGAA